MILRKGSAVAVIVRSGPERPSPAKGVLLEKKERTRMVLHRIADVMRRCRGSPTQIANHMNGSFKSEENLESENGLCDDAIGYNGMEIGVGAP
jgi:hypothetical protein